MRGLTLSGADTLTGTSTAAYDADGTAKTVTYPGGLTASTATDDAGNPIRLTYAKAGTTWMTFAQTESIHGQVRTATSPTSQQLNTYDPAGRLTRVDDQTATDCTRRDYTFDPDTNRTSLTTTTGTAAPTPAALCDLTGATPATVTNTYDAADRANATGYTYDNLGRTTAAPASAVTGGAALAIGYSANDMVRTLTQSGHTKTYDLDPANRILTVADTGGPTLTDHYTETGDNPAWVAASDGTWTRYTDAPGGGLGLSVNSAGTVQLQLTNLHGDVVATCGPTDTGPAASSETTEYGLPRSPNSARYGWLGTHHRDTGDALAQLTLMGARLYNPTTGRFLSVDPVPGGSCNNYDYTCADPINGQDLDGRRFGWLRRAARAAYRDVRQNWVSYSVTASCIFLSVVGCAAISAVYLIGSTYSTYRRTGRVSWGSVAVNAAFLGAGSGAGRYVSRGWRARNVSRIGKHRGYHHRGAGGHHRRRINRWGTALAWGKNAAISGSGYYGSRRWA